MTRVHDTSDFIIDELNKHGVRGEWWHTGGGCTAVQILLEGLGVGGANGYILITDGDARADLSEIEQTKHVGWVAGYYPSEDDLGYGENVEYMHGGKLMQPNHLVTEVPLVPVLGENGEPLESYDGTPMMLPDWPVVDWREDAKQLATNVASFVADLRDCRG